MRRRRNSRTQGFTLLEVLVAFTILALVMGALLQIFSGGMRTAGVSRNYAVGALLAESKLAGIGIEEPLVAGVRTGTFDNGYRWHYSIDPYQEQDGAQAEQEELVPYQLILTIEWGPAGSGGSVTLTTLRLGSTADATTGGARQ
jgi:general secretion pathway protein I